MKKRHRGLLRRVEAINMRREIESKRHAYRRGQQVREALGPAEGRRVLAEIHAAELAACPTGEVRAGVADTHRMEVEGFEGGRP